MLPKCLKWLQEAGSAFFGKDITFMLVMTNYAKIYASTIYQSLILVSLSRVSFWSGRKSVPRDAVLLRKNVK